MYRILSKYQITREEADKLRETKFWEHLQETDIVKFQMFQTHMSMPFSILMNAVERITGQNVNCESFKERDIWDDILDVIHVPKYYDDLKELLPEQFQNLIEERELIL